jgi:hypothetical protein
MFESFTLLTIVFLFKARAVFFLFTLLIIYRKADKLQLIDVFFFPILKDCAMPLVRGVVATDDPNVAFKVGRLWEVASLRLPNYTLLHVREFFIDFLRRRMAD